MKETKKKKQQKKTYYNDYLIGHAGSKGRLTLNTLLFSILNELSVSLPSFYAITNYDSMKHIMCGENFFPS